MNRHRYPIFPHLFNANGRGIPACPALSVTVFSRVYSMSHSALFNAQLHVPLRALALTVEETAPGDFRWRILEGRGNPQVFESVACSDLSFTAYDTALATGYGELQRLIGPDLQYGPRRDVDDQPELFGMAVAPRPQVIADEDDLAKQTFKGGGIQPDTVSA